MKVTPWIFAGCAFVLVSGVVRPRKPTFKPEDVVMIVVSLNVGFPL